MDTWEIILKDNHYDYDSVTCDCSLNIWTLTKNGKETQIYGAARWAAISEPKVFISSWASWDIVKEQSDSQILKEAKLELVHPILGTKRASTPELYLHNINKTPPMDKRILETIFKQTTKKPWYINLWNKINFLKKLIFN